MTSLPRRISVIGGRPWAGDYTCVADPQRIVQARDIALIVAGPGIQVARRGRDQPFQPKLYANDVPSQHARGWCISGSTCHARVAVARQYRVESAGTADFSGKTALSVQLPFRCWSDPGISRRTVLRRTRAGGSKRPACASLLVLPFPTIAYSGSGTGWGGGGPTYSALGRISRLSAACSMTCAVQPIVRLAVKVGVNIAGGRPTVSITMPA